MSMTLTCIAASPAGKWSGVGTTEQATVDDSAIVLTSSDAETAGGLSSTVEFSNADAALVTATVANATERAVTFGVQDASDGASIGYWQNPVPCNAEQNLAAVLPLARNIDRARLFAGTHRKPSGAIISTIEVLPVREGDAARGSIWAAWVDGTRDQCQTFVASGALEAVTVRLRHFHPGQTSGGLRVRVYEWTGEIAPSRRSPPIGDAIIPAALIPAGEEGNERDVSVAIKAPTQEGKTYLLSFSLAEGKQEQSLLLWAGPDSYSTGNLFENDKPMTDWDLYFATYYAR